MAIYTVHEPPRPADGASPAPERYVFVRDGFSFAATLFGPLWMLRHRMWLALLGYGTVVVLLGFGLRMIQASTAVGLTVGALLALLVGFEAGTLRRFTLARRRFRNVGLVVADDIELAERRFFDSWVKSQAEGEPSSLHAFTPMLHMPPASPDVLGLFPQPGAPR